MQSNHYFSIRSRFVEERSVMPLAILTALAVFTVVGILFDIASASA